MKKVLVHDRLTVEVWYGLPYPPRLADRHIWLPILDGIRTTLCFRRPAEPSGGAFPEGSKFQAAVTLRPVYGCRLPGSPADPSDGYPTTAPDSLPAAGQALPHGIGYPQGLGEGFK